MGVAGAVAGTFGIQPLVGAFGVPYQAAEPRDERQIRLLARIAAKCHRVSSCPDPLGPEFPRRP